MNYLGKRVFFLIITFLLLCMVFIGCKNRNDSSGEIPGQNYNEDISVTEPYSSVRLFSLPQQLTVQYTFPAAGELPSLPFGTRAHQEHLKDPLVFTQLPESITGNTAVVGSDICLFYPIESISSADELGKLPQGELIPFAAIIPLGEELRRDIPYMDGMFEFQDNFNYFYKTTWNGKNGIVFGADLYGIKDSNTDNRINAMLYKNNGYFESFYPFAGYNMLSEEIRRELETNGLAFQTVSPREYSLYLPGRPDDMISLYTGLPANRTPIFVTTDLAAHANHLVFSRMLQYIEEEYFFPQLVLLTNEYIKAIEQRKNQTPAEVYNASLLYFQTAHALLALAPERVKEQGHGLNLIEYRDVNFAKVLQNYPAQIAEVIEKMNRAEGFEASFFGTLEDYSQYKVRGHYTKNGVLGAYFRALMWYGRINFILGGETDRIRQQAAQFAPAALFIADITENSPELKRLWQSLFDPITELIGASDDISFNELIPLWNRIKGTGFTQWYNDPVKRNAFITREYAELRPPSISGSSLFLERPAGDIDSQELLPPIGWGLFGQRYTLDSEIHYHVSPPRFIVSNVPDSRQRQMVRGLDIIKVLGSRTADQLLRENDYPIYPGLEEILNSLQRNLENVNSGYWLSTYYTNILYQIKTLGRFENGSGFYFTEQPGWNLKAMNSAHGTWAELRHDTLLYVKQSYAERGGGPNEPTFRTKPLPQPVHYIEPNIPFWIISALGVQNLYQILNKYNYLDDRTAQVLKMLHDLFIKAAEISGLQAENLEVSRNDLTWISRFASQLANLVITHIGGSSTYVDDIDSLRMALVADVYTNAELGLVLETAVGIPYRLYIPLNDRQGGKRIAVGYGFSYYEFTQPISDRLNNEQWKAIVYGNNPDMSRYLPFWMRGRVQPANR